VACGGLLLSAARAGNIVRPASTGAETRGYSTALSSKREQFHVDSRVDKAERKLVFIHLNFCGRSSWFLPAFERALK